LFLSLKTQNIAVVILNSLASGIRGKEIERKHFATILRAL
jgi:hypothetical protein